LALTGCANALQAAQGEPELATYHSPDIDDLTIDLEAGVAWTENWQAPAEDCSTRDFDCVRIIGRADIAFPHVCPAHPDDLEFDSPAGRFRSVAPMPHLAPPSGSYISERYPNVLLYYERGKGFWELRITAAAPFQDNFNPNETTERYNITISGRPQMFICSNQ